MRLVYSLSDRGRRRSFVAGVLLPESLELGQNVSSQLQPVASTLTSIAPVAPPPGRARPKQKRPRVLPVLVPLGGGKNSLVALRLLQQAGAYRRW